MCDIHRGGAVGRLQILMMRALICTLLLTAAAASAQTVATPAAGPTIIPGLPIPIFGPPPPEAPATAARDAAGRLTIRAVRLTSPLRIDGRMDDAAYGEALPVSDFLQIEPKPGTPATQQTEYWIFYDDDNVYVGVKAHESNLDRMTLNELRRDHPNITQNEYVNFVFDTFYDRRNAQIFVVSAAGARMDGQLTNERQYNGDWNPVWEVRTGRFEGGWTIEAAIPFKSLRYRPGRQQVWGLHVSRYNRWKNEISYPIPMPPERGTAGSFQMSAAPTLVGIEAPAAGRNLEIKPYAISSVASDVAATPRLSNDLDADVGGDLKYGITQGVVADLTYNTDFAQVEADEQQVNLTRFSLFFPEKRDFFLENQGTFAFGGLAASGGGDAPILFYSRRIGLNGARVVPIHGGGRLTGRAGAWSLGLLDIQAKKDDLSALRSTNFSVVRVKRDVLRRSSIGALFTGRSVTQSGIGSSQTYGADGVFAFYENLLVNTYFARTATTGRTGDDTSYRAQLDWAADRYGVQLEHLAIGANFNPEIGFVRRSDIRKSYAMARFSPRPKRFASVRKFFYQGSINHLENGAGRLEFRDVQGQAAVEYQNSDRLSLDYNRTYEFIPAPFRIAPLVTVPIGAYEADNARLAFRFGQQRRVSGTAAVEYGTFYGGDKLAAGFTGGRMKIHMQLSIEPMVSINRVELPQGSFTTNLVGSRVTYTMTPLMFVSALIQYNSLANTASSNVRLRWEYRPGSELFVVYNDQRNTLDPGFPALMNRTFIVKVNRLFRF
jgi:hypothetical protein